VTEGVLSMIADASCGCAWADYDNDGDLDLFVANGLDYIDGTRPPEPGFLYRNDNGTNNWLILRLVGVASNRSAIGPGSGSRYDSGQLRALALRDGSSLPHAARQEHVVPLAFLRAQGEMTVKRS